MPFKLADKLWEHFRDTIQQDYINAERLLKDKSVLEIRGDPRIEVARELNTWMDLIENGHKKKVPSLDDDDDDSDYLLDDESDQDIQLRRDNTGKVLTGIAKVLSTQPHGNDTDVVKSRKVGNEISEHIKKLKQDGSVNPKRIQALEDIVHYLNKFPTIKADFIREIVYYQHDLNNVPTEDSAIFKFLNEKTVASPSIPNARKSQGISNSPTTKQAKALDNKPVKNATPVAKTQLPKESRPENKPAEIKEQKRPIIQPAQFKKVDDRPLKDSDPVVQQPALPPEKYVKDPRKALEQILEKSEWNGFISPTQLEEFYKLQVPPHFDHSKITLEQCNTWLNEYVENVAIRRGNIFANVNDARGNFYWRCNDAEQPAESQKNKQVPRSKFRILADLGQLPDNEILSNKMINICGKRVFDLMRDASKKKTPLTAYEAMDIHLNNQMVQKMRAVQKIDLLLNSTSAYFKKNYQSFIKDARTELESLLRLENEKLKDPNEPDYIKDIRRREIQSMQNQLERLSNLTIELGKKADAPPFERNTVLIEWQRSSLKKLTNDYRRNESLLSLHRDGIPRPVENSSASNTAQNLFYCLQKHVYNEARAMTEDQLWLNDSEIDVVDSTLYTQGGGQRKDFLLATAMAEKLSASNNVVRICDDRENLSGMLQKARTEIYTPNKERIRDTSKQYKSTLKKPTLRERFSHLLTSTPEPTGLTKTSTEFTNWLRSFRSSKSIQNELSGAIDAFGKKFKIEPARTKIDTGLVGGIDQTPATPSTVAPTGATPAATIAPAAPPSAPAPAPAAPKKLKFAPAANALTAYQSDDLVTGILNFTNKFALFFDSEISAKRPYLATAFFWMPFFNMALPALAGTVVCAKVAALQLSMEAYLAKTSGLNFIFHSATGINITPDTLAQLTHEVSDALGWATHAEGTLEKALLGLLVAKGTFTLADLANNPMFRGEKGAQLLHELLAKTGGTLEHLDVSEKLARGAYAGLKISAELALASGMLAVIETFVPFLSEVLKELAVVDMSDITTMPVGVEFIQRLAVAKAASMTLFKVIHVMHEVKNGRLIDRDGTVIVPGSNSFKVIGYFLDLQAKIEKKRNIEAQIDALLKDPKADKDLLMTLKNAQKTSQTELDAIVKDKSYNIMRQHFQQLLYANPPLLDAFKNDKGECPELRELGVKKVAPPMWRKAIMAFIKAIPIVLLFAAFLITLPLAFFTTLGTAAYSKQFKEPNRFIQLCLKCQEIWGKVGLVFWTLLKAPTNAMGEVLMRIPELLVGTAFVAAYVAASVFRIIPILVNSLFKIIATNAVHYFSLGAKIFGINIDPKYKNWLGSISWTEGFIAKPFKAFADWIKDGGYSSVATVKLGRLWVKEKGGNFLEWCRDKLIRNTERRIQAAHHQEQPEEQTKLESPVKSDAKSDAKVTRVQEIEMADAKKPSSEPGLPKIRVGAPAPYKTTPVSRSPVASVPSKTPSSTFTHPPKLHSVVPSPSSANKFKGYKEQNGKQKSNSHDLDPVAQTQTTTKSDSKPEVTTTPAADPNISLLTKKKSGTYNNENSEAALFRVAKKFGLNKDSIHKDSIHNRDILKIDDNITVAESATSKTVEFTGKSGEVPPDDEIAKAVKAFILQNINPETYKIRGKLDADGIPKPPFNPELTVNITRKDDSKTSKELEGLFTKKCKSMGLEIVPHSNTFKDTLMDMKRATPSSPSPSSTPIANPPR